MPASLPPKTIIMFSLALLPSGLTQAGQSALIGYAYHVGTRQLAYTEEHTFPDTLSHHVIYKEADGTVFASKTIDYSDSYIAPDIIQENHRNGERIKTELMGDVFKVSYRASFGKDTQHSDVTLSPDLVIDAGFDHYIRSNWDSLVAEKETVIQYLIPSHQRAIDLRIKPVECKKDPKDTNICFNIAADSWLYRLLSSPLTLSYDKQSQRLMTFSGRSNISDKKGDYQDVTIHYQPHQPAKNQEISYVTNECSTNGSVFVWLQLCGYQPISK
ncbi:hypothetical protein [Endozoicomonas sp. 4G]|uniref:hypothetical protein n=1 Tax=Endozoicomonas sp. 4G TaxID=2872754 RepID=UPI002078EDEC|nr:hypothetical protein [Endozoicomonas sp. 4G]